MSGKPRKEDVTPPWEIVDCDCDGPCNKCDGAGWYYHVPGTSMVVSDMIVDALSRHG